eukprot:s1129_g3.t1
MFIADEPDMWDATSAGSVVRLDRAACGRAVFAAEASLGQIHPSTRQKRVATRQGRISIKQRGDQPTSAKEGQLRQCQDSQSSGKAVVLSSGEPRPGRSWVF